MTARLAALLVAVAVAGCARNAAPPPQDAEPAATPSPSISISDSTSTSTSTLPPPPSRLGRDTVRGVVAVTGAEPQWRLTLTTAAGQVYDVTSAGGAATPLSELKAADHLEVTLLGDITAGAGELPAARGFRMAAFLVRAADGADAVDGLLVRDLKGYALRLQDGTALPIARLPQALEGQVGARIYWVGATDAPPAAYGVLREPAPLRPPGR